MTPIPAAGDGDAPSPPRVLLATASEFRDEDEDLEPLLAALQDRGIDAAAADWHDAGVAWGAADLVVIRSTWDYHRDLGSFLGWVDATAATTLLANPAPMIRWNADKRYLLDLAAAGLPVLVPTVLDPGATDDEVGAAIVTASRRDGSGVVVKPTVSAGSRDTARYADDPADHARAIAHADALLAAGRAVLVQPFEASVDTWGETALLYLGGQWSHAVRKAPMLRPGADPSATRPGDGELTPREPTDAERAVADDVVAWLGSRFGTAPLYARIDLLAGDRDAPLVLEVEVLEPALFCRFAAGATERFADAVSGLL